MSYLPIHLHTSWSLLDSTATIETLIPKAKEYGIPALCMTDHNNIKGVVPFFKQCKESNIKPIIGVELDVYNGEAFSGRITLLAKNKTGYKNIVKLVSMARTKEALSFNGMPRTQTSSLTQYSAGLICLVGDVRSQIFFSSYINPEMAYESDSIDDCKSLIRKDWKQCVTKVIADLSKIYENVFLYYDLSFLPCAVALGTEIKKEFPDALPSANIHYLNKEDYDLHKLIKQSKDESASDCCKGLEDARIFDSRYVNCHLMKSLPGGEKTLKILDLIEDYSIQERPMLPAFKILDNKIEDPHEYLKEICRKGFKSTGLISNLKINPQLKEIYIKRIQHELEVFKQANMSGYFLIVNDIMNQARKSGVPADIRGSSSGCMISYLMEISSIDPMQPDPTLGYDAQRELSFERFYNEGRNTKDNASLPDIDIDVPPSFREGLISYIKEKYGSDCVGHIITHSRFKGKGAIKEVFKLMKPVENYFDLSNQITKKLVDETKIADDLNEMQKEDAAYGIIRWNIDHIKSIAEYYESFKQCFDFAIKMEAIAKNESVHAAGIIISDQPLSNLFPMTYSEKLDSMIIDIEGSDIEYLGGVKFDILGVSALEKVFQIEQMINNNLSEIEFGEFSFSYFD